MTDTRYKITMDGSLAPDVSLAEAQENFAHLFKTDISSIKRLFTSGPTVIKRNINSAEADKYLQALRSVGVIAHKEMDVAVGLSLEAIPSDAVEASAQDTISADSADSTARMICPKCTAEQLDNEICQSCGIVIAKFNSYQSAQSQLTPPSYAGSASPYATSKAIIEQDADEVGELSIWGVEGRLGRMRSIAWSMVLMFAMAPAMLIGMLAFRSSMVLGSILLAVICLAAIVIGIQISVKRLHDIGWSGWLLLIAFIPVVGNIFQFLLLVLPGSKKSNRYGAVPPPNSAAVKVLFWLWVVFLLFGLVFGLLGGLTAAILTQ